jgi:putative acetyltransferase
VSPGRYTLRAYAATDEDAAIELWRRSWQAAMPHLDFAARADWWRKRWREELVPQASIVVALDGDTLAGLVTVDPSSGYLDQLVVAPDAWGGGLAALLIDQAKRLSPTRLDLLVNKDNARAIRFYEKHGFAKVGRKYFRLGDRDEDDWVLERRLALLA